jgi:hypothetical protein
VRVLLHAQHGGELVAAGAQGPECLLLLALRPVEGKTGGKAVAGDQSGIDLVGLGPPAIEAGEQAGAAAMGAMERKAQGGGLIEDVAFVAAGRFAHDQQRTEVFCEVAGLLAPEQAAQRRLAVGETLLPVGRQDMDHQLGLGDLEGDDVVEAGGGRVHAHGAVRSSWIICGREGLSTVRMAGYGSSGGPR